MIGVNDRWNNRNKRGGYYPDSIAEDHRLTSNGISSSPVVPSVADNAEAAETENPEGSEIAKPELSDYSWATDMIGQWTQKPMTEEEQEKRKRAATAVQGIGHLGNVFSAFSNLIYAGKGAPSQTISAVPETDLKSFEDRVAEKRRMYVSDYLTAKERDYNRYQSDMKQYYRGKGDEREEKLTNARMKSLEGEHQYNQEKIEYQRLVTAGLPAKQAAELAYKNAQVKEREAAAKRNVMQGRAATTTGGRDKRNDSSSSSSRKDYGKIVLEGPEGSSREYDMNNDDDVIELYKLAKSHYNVTGGITDVKRMRDELKFKSGDFNYAKTHRLVSAKGELNWGGNNNEEVDW